MSVFGPVTIDLVDVVPKWHDGYPDDLAKLDTRERLRDCCGAATRDFPSSLWIDPKDWREVAKQNDENKTWGINYVDRFTNQGSGNGGYSTHECTCHSLATHFGAAWNLQRGIIVGPPQKGVRLPTSAKASPLWVSALSVYIEANPSEWGGANVQQVLEIAVRRGFLPDKIQPKPYKFKHTLHGTCGAGGINQSRGPWVKLRDLPEGWEETAKHIRPLEVIFPDSFEEAMCLLLHARLVSVGRDGHAVPWAGIDFESEVIPYVDSYDVVRFDSFKRAKSAYRGSFCIMSTTTPDDWDKPAG